jgi:hypothetical protein
MAAPKLTASFLMSSNVGQGAPYFFCIRGHPSGRLGFGDTPAPPSDPDRRSCLSLPRPSRSHGFAQCGSRRGIARRVDRGGPRRILGVRTGLRRGDSKGEVRARANRLSRDKVSNPHRCWRQGPFARTGYANGLQAEIEGSELIVFENAAHFSHIDEPERFNRVAIEFLSRAWCI